MTHHRASWILVLPILAAGCAGGPGHPAAEKQRSVTVQKQAPSSAAKPAAPARVRKVATPAAPKQAKKMTKPVKTSKPRQRQRSLPWRPDGISEVAHVRVRRIGVYRSLAAKHASLVLGKRDVNGTQRTFLVRETRGDWVRVFLPTRPNMSQGWVKRRSVRVYTNGYRLVVRLRSHELRLWRGDQMVAKYPVAIGTRSTPTPRGLYYIVELLKPSDPNGSYGPFSFGLSAHSNVLKRFAGGDGRVGLHGTNQPGLIGSNVSHGCIRLRNAAVRRLAKILPLGTPVYVRS
ncbi:MAG: L,D-transpeptidase [Actinobacteria bacterium]|nr:L,D-transpeptidase [Actinomycetota bacterium]